MIGAARALVLALIPSFPYSAPLEDLKIKPAAR